MPAQKTALITGVTGQDGSYLADLLLEKGYRVVGLVRRRATDPFPNLAHILDRIEIVVGDMTDGPSLQEAVEESQPDEVYNLASQSFVGSSWELPEMTADVVGLGLVRLLQAIRKRAPQARVFQASSSEIFGRGGPDPLNEDSPLHPRNPYGSAKCFAHYAAGNFREGYDLFVCCGIMFNHESPRRGAEFVTRKIARAAAAIKLGLQTTVALGSLDAQRDWGFAGDYVQVMWAMLQQDSPDDYVIGSGALHSVEDFVAQAFTCVDLDWREHVVQDERFMRRSDVTGLRADAAKAARELNWRPSVSFERLVADMVNAELAALNGASSIAPNS